MKFVIYEEYSDNGDRWLKLYRKRPFGLTRVPVWIGAERPSGMDGNKDGDCISRLMKVAERHAATCGKKPIVITEFSV